MVVGDIAEGVEVLVIGGGPGGYVAAIRAASFGKDVTLVEADALGGVCLNRGCIPSKALISAADKYYQARHSFGDFGIDVSGATLDMSRMQAWKDSVVAKLTGGVSQLLKGRGVRVIQGKARFTAPDQVVVDTGGIGEGTVHLRFEHCIIATGSEPAPIPVLPVDGVTVLDSTGALALDTVPEELVIVGGGYIGVELGTVYAKLGSKVTIVEAMDRLLPGTDASLVQMVARRLRSLGVTMHLGAKALGLEDGTEAGSGKGKGKGKGKAAAPARVGVQVETKKGERLVLPADKVFVTVGRRPRSRDLGLENAGVKVDDRGFIPVNDRQQTNVPNIYAIGDVAGQPMLAHKASKEGIVAAEVIAGRPAAMDAVAIPAVIFSDPEIAYVGLTPDDAKAQGRDVIVGKFPFAANGRALGSGDTTGFVQLVGDKETGVVLGAQIVGPEASNLIAEAGLAIELGATMEDIALTIHAHPTLAETMMEAAEMALGTPVHLLPR